METKMIKANPTREFFVNMLVRDILLKQAIIELIDNSIDGARTIKKDNDFTGLKIAVDFDGDSFCIRDNCGGIPLDVAQEYAFRFGRPKEKETGNNETTGIFGIGMKRALFKLGDYFEIKSKTVTTSFEVKLDVEQWENEESNNWDFPFFSYQENLCNSLESTGTTITVSRLRKEISADLKSRDFEKELIEHIQRRVGLDIDNGIIIEVNGKKLIGNHVKLVNGEDIQPVKESYIHGNVKVKIVAGIAEKKEKEKYTECTKTAGLRLERLFWLVKIRGNGYNKPDIRKRWGRAWLRSSRSRRRSGSRPVRSALFWAARRQSGRSARPRRKKFLRRRHGLAISPIWLPGVCGAAAVPMSWWWPCSGHRISGPA